MIQDEAERKRSDFKIRIRTITSFVATKKVTPSKKVWFSFHWSVLFIIALELLIPVTNKFYQDF